MAAFILTLLTVFIIIPTSFTAAQTVNADSSLAGVEFDCSYAGAYRNGSSYDFVTLAPNGNGDSFASTGITIRVRLRDDAGKPIVGFPAEDITISANACLCPGTFADSLTNQEGWTTITGPIHGGGSAFGLSVLAGGIEIGQIPVRFNTPIQGSTARCWTDAGDYSYIAGRYGAATGHSGYQIDKDFNEDGYIDLVDFVVFNGYRGTCPQVATSTDDSFHKPIDTTRYAASKSPEIGIYFDSEGTIDCASLSEGGNLEFWILADLQDSPLSSFAGVEFQITGLTNVVSVFTPSNTGLGLGGPFIGNAIAYEECMTSANGRVVIGSGILYAFEPIPSMTLTVQAWPHDANANRDCPMFSICNPPTACASAEALAASTVCAIGQQAFINPLDPETCTVAVETRTWGEVKLHYRE